jgi:FkbM family methyltransferase
MKNKRQRFSFIMRLLIRRIHFPIVNVLSLSVAHSKSIQGANVQTFGPLCFYLNEVVTLNSKQAKAVYNGQVLIFLMPKANLMKQSQKRFIRRILQTLRLEKPLRAVYRAILSARLNRKYGDKSIHEVRIQGVKVLFNIDDLFSKRYFFVDNTALEELVTEFIAQRLKGAEVFVDVGANLGYYTCIAGKLLPAGKIHAFEMDALNYALLKRNVELNQFSNVLIHKMAVSDQVGVLEYIRDTDSPSLGFGLSRNAGRDQKYGELVSVPTTTLDAVLEEYQGESMVIKIDVEGAEYDILRGMTRMLNEDRIQFFIEMHPDRILNFNATTDDVLHLLFEHGYKIYEIDKKPTRQSLRELQPLQRGALITKNNIIYAHKSGADNESKPRP